MTRANDRCGAEYYVGDAGSIYCDREPDHDGQHEGQLQFAWDRDDDEFDSSEAWFADAEEE